MNSTMRVTVHYDPDQDCLRGTVDRGCAPDSDSPTRTTVWSDQLDFQVMDDRVVGFVVREFRYFTDFLPFYRLFGSDFVGWLSALQDRLTGEHVQGDGDFDVPDEGRTKRDQEFERRLARI